MSIFSNAASDSERREVVASAVARLSSFGRE